MNTTRTNIGTDVNSARQKGPLLLAVVLASLLHLTNISAPTLLVALLMWLWHLIGLFRPLPRPGARGLVLAGALCFALAAATNEGVTVEAFVSLLVLMIALKLFEMRGRHDAIMTVILNYFAIVSGMFFSDSLLVSLYIALALTYNTAMLIRTSHPDMAMRLTLRHAVRLCGLALPCMIVLFLVFPRFPGGLWGRPQLIQGKSGVSDVLRFGGIAAVAKNQDVAFRVTFEGGTPHETFYWRGVVLGIFDGTSWTRDRRNRTFGPEQARSDEKSGPGHEYSITLEAHQERWLYTLDRPLAVEFPRGTYMREAQVVETWRPVANRLEYRARSATFARLEPQGFRAVARRGLQLPEGGNPRARALAQKWRTEHTSPQDIANAALAHFAQNGFRYVLAADTALDENDVNAIDAFLFDVKTGFCEHFAASFAFLMRAAGVPARLVIGYLGGTVNPMGDYLVVRHADAHAWCELLIDGHWQRVDPTVIVAPDRLNAGVAEVPGAGGQDLSLAELLNWRNLPPWLQPLGNAWDFLNMRWNQWVMQYSAAQQRNFLVSLGLNWGRMAGRIGLLLGGVAVLGIGYFALAVFVRRRPQGQDPVAAQWRRFLVRLDQAHLESPSDMGPRDLLAAITAARPDLTHAAAAVIQPYIRLRYANTPQADRPALLRDLTRAVRAFPTVSAPPR